MSTLAGIRAQLDPVATGEDLHALIARLYPICRSITGPGVRETLRILGERLPLQVHEVPTGTPVLDWTVPREWTVRDAYVADSGGRRLVDFHASNLHVLNYSVPIRARMTLDELRPHLFTLPDQPAAIPYRTSYYNENWGFCLAHEALGAFSEDETYEVVIDSTLADGSLSYGECAIEGSEPESEVLVSAHVCHPSLCNDNLSGMAVAARLAELLAAGGERRFTYRFVFVPGTIGSITWLARNRDAAMRVRAGLVLTGVGDPGPPSYKRSRRGDALIDRAMAHVIGADGPVRDFSPWGYDERQYGSPGFDLPVGVLARTQHGTYPEYHTSGDDLGFVRPESLADSLDRALAAFDVLERDGRFENLSPFGEPQLGRRGLYGAIGGAADERSQELAMLWVLNQSDGTRSLLEIAERAGIPFATVADVAALLVEHELLAPAGAALSQRDALHC